MRDAGRTFQPLTFGRMSPTTPRDVVLLLTHSGDFYTVDLVAQALARRGVRPIRFNTDLFPSRIRLSAHAGDERSAVFFTETGEQISSEEVRAVWARKLWPPRMNDDLDERYRSMCVNESAAALDGFLDALHSARWVNDLACQREAENKQRQLRLAARAGLRVPRTVVTNDPAAARQFFAETDGQTVAKLLRPVEVSMDAVNPFVYTNRVCEEDLAGAETLRHSPMVFQELIPKAYELRIACVAGRVFAGALNATGTSRGHTDWRRASPEECRWQKAQLPAEVASSLQSLMSELGLVFGAVDLICTPAGEHVFLEVNPSGEWGMLERDLDLPISEALAQVARDSRDGRGPPRDVCCYRFRKSPRVQLTIGGATA
jgi:MvdC family ATP-grasp ribosomal peptide maturase